MFCRCLSVFLSIRLSIYLSIDVSLYIYIYTTFALCLCLYQPPFIMHLSFLCPLSIHSSVALFFLFLLFPPPARPPPPPSFIQCCKSPKPEAMEKQKQRETKREEKMESHHQKYVWIHSNFKFHMQLFNYYCCLALCRVHGKQSLNQPYETWPAIWGSLFSVSWGVTPLNWG